MCRLTKLPTRIKALVTVEALSGRVDDGQVVAGASSDHQVERTPLQQLGRQEHHQVLD